MRSKQEIQSDIDGLDIEMRSLLEAVKDETKAFNKEEVEKRRAELAEKRAGFCKELAALSAPPITDTEERGLLYNRQAWIDAAKEKRTLQIGTTTPNTGSINQIGTLYKEISAGDELLNSATTIFGRDASTNIPVLTPLSEPSDYAEGATTVATDSTAAVTITEIQPKAYAIVLPLTAEMLTMGSVNMEAELGGIFQKAFRRVMHKGMLNGAGTSKTMKGIYTSAGATGATVTPQGTKNVLLISELAKLALSVVGLDEEYRILMPTSLYQKFVSDQTNGEDVKIYKEGLIRDKSIEGVKIILDDFITLGDTAGSPLVVAAPLARYTIGIAQQLVIDPIKVKGDTNTYYQATMFFSGKQVSDKDFRSITLRTT